MYVLFLFFVIVLLKFILNFARLLETYYLFHKFQLRPKNLAQYCPFVTSIFNSAGTQQTIPITLRSNGVKYRTVDYISNILTDYASQHDLEVIFQQTIGVYKLRILQFFNPFYWIFLPKYILESHNISLSKPWRFLLHILYWILDSSAAYFFNEYIAFHFGEIIQHIIRMFP